VKTICLRILRNRKGFTLVELLIVIVILGILAAIRYCQICRATKESKESNLKGNLRTIRSSLETFKANSKSNSYPSNLDDLWKGTAEDVDSKTFLERIPIDPFYRTTMFYLATTIFSPIDAATDRDAIITGGGGWAYDSLTGRVCANYKSTDTTAGEPLDTSWGLKYNIW